MSRGICRPSAAAAALVVILCASPAGGQTHFRRGDSNASAAMDLSDGIHVLGFLFRGEPGVLGCRDASDANDDGKLDLSDGITILGRLFRGDPPLAPPFESCGPDATADALECASFAPCPGPEGSAYRITELELRDPHAFALAGCGDVTVIVNGLLKAALIADGDDPDEFLDLNLLLIFPSGGPTAPHGGIEIAGGLCTVPAAATTCTRDAEIGQTVFSGESAEPCPAVLPGTTGLYEPEVTSPSAPCFLTEPVALTLEVGVITLPLEDVTIAAAIAGDPAMALNGVLRGFLVEETADLTLIPAGIPTVGGQPLSLLLPGGATNCAAHDDRDTRGGARGWWFYFNFTAVEVEAAPGG